jgi:hypothetical protein
MNNRQIGALLESHRTTSKSFIGVFASDTLPSNKNIPKPYSMVVNLDPFAKSGSHWVSIYAPKGELMEYFDSYGVEAKVIKIKNYLERPYIFNMNFIQHPLSTVCGQYCIYYILMRNRGWSMGKIIKSFNTKTKILNDGKVNHFVTEQFHVHLHVFDKTYLHKQIATSLEKFLKKV